MRKILRIGALLAALALGAYCGMRWLRTDYLPGRLWAAATRAEQAGSFAEALDRYEEFFTRYPADPRCTGPLLSRVIGCLRGNPALSQPHLADVAELYVMFRRRGFKKGASIMEAEALAILGDQLSGVGSSLLKAAGLGLMARRLSPFTSDRELLALAFEYRRSLIVGVLLPVEAHHHVRDALSVAAQKSLDEAHHLGAPLLLLITLQKTVAVQVRDLFPKG